jgi:pimeloyl-ACP methyl ester carboxylesterase
MSVSVSFIINIAVAVTAIIFTLYFNTNYDHTLPFKYKNYGDPNRPPIVIIPGLDGCVSFFQDVIPELTVEYNVIVFHLPLCDPSKDCSISYTFPHISLELKKVLDELKLKRVSIIGESFGGVVAQQFAYQYPKHVSSLVLLSSLGK